MFVFNRFNARPRVTISPIIPDIFDAPGALSISPTKTLALTQAQKALIGTTVPSLLFLPHSTSGIPFLRGSRLGSILDLDLPAIFFRLPAGMIALPLNWQWAIRPDRPFEAANLILDYPALPPPLPGPANQANINDAFRRRHLAHNYTEAEAEMRGYLHRDDVDVVVPGPLKLAVLAVLSFFLWVFGLVRPTVDFCLAAFHFMMLRIILPGLAWVFAFVAPLEVLLAVAVAGGLASFLVPRLPGWQGGVGASAGVGAAVAAAAAGGGEEELVFFVASERAMGGTGPVLRTG